MGRRLALAREEFSFSQEELADLFEIGLRTYARIESGERPLNALELSALQKIGISIAWLLNGVGPMRLGLGEEGAPFEITIDEELMGQIVDSLTKLFREENQRLAPVHQGRLSAQLYNDLRVIEDEAERRGALRYAIEAKRKELRQAVSGTDFSKRQA